MQPSEPNVTSFRTEIDSVDRELIRLLATRDACAKQIGAHKRAHDRPLRDPQREREVATRWRQLADAEGVSPELAESILSSVLDHSRRLQERPSQAPSSAARAGYQGVPGCHGDDALRRLFAGRGDVVPLAYRSFAEVIAALQSGQLDYALLPIENSVSGGIDEVANLLAECRELHVVDEEVHEVRHALAVPAGTRLDDVDRVRSHPVALAQCASTLRSLGLEPEPWFDTAGAADSIVGETRVAALCPPRHAHALGLDVLRSDASDAAENRTRFLLIGRTPEAMPHGVPGKTALLLTVDHRAGALAHSLDALASRGVNLTRIESRPVPGRAFEYRFFLDIEGHPDEDLVDEALHAVRCHARSLRVLGTYPDRSRTVTDLPSPPRARPAGDGPPALAKRREHGSRVQVGSLDVGGDTFALILGPCAVESSEQIQAAAELVQRHGAHALRGGAFKPRTSPYSFQGLGHDGVKLLCEAGRAHGLPVITEVVRPEDVDAVAESVDVLQIGARNMQNFALLQAAGSTDTPVLLKRGMSATLDELLHATEYILNRGNQRVILCERGIRTFETATRNTLDISAVPILKAKTHLPVIVDPSHAAGRRDLVVPLALAAAAAGADGLIVEAHPDPDSALSDGPQALTEAELMELRQGLIPLIEARGMSL